MGNTKTTKYHIASDIMDKVNKAIDACERKYKIFIKYNVTVEKIEKKQNQKSIDGSKRKLL